MICPDCQKGMVFVMRGPNQDQQARPYGGEMFLENPEKYFDKIPCQRCNGSGIAYCCDGEDYNAECYSNGDNNPGKNYIRIALVNNAEITDLALKKISKGLLEIQ